MKNVLNIMIILFTVIISILLFFVLIKDDSESYEFKINGDTDIYLLLNGQYNDSGVIAFYNGKNYADKIIVTSDFDSSVVRTYTIKYEFKEVNKSLERRIHVDNFDNYFIVDYPTDLSNEIDLNIKIDTEKVDRYVLPDGSVKHENTTYKIDDNGTYSFTIYDKYNNSVTKNIVISNISTIDIIPTPIATLEPSPIATQEPIVTPTTNPTIVPTIVPSIEPTMEPESQKMEIHFIGSQVGYYDDSILIRTKKATIYMDGGRGAAAAVSYLKKMNVTTIDYVIGSHTEMDHIDAQADIIRQFDVKHALYPNSITNCGCSCTSDDVRNVTAALKEKNMTPEVQSVPSKLQIGDMTLYFIAPYTIGCNKNNNSFIFILQYGSTKFMFTGDADSDFNNQAQMENNAKSLGLSGIEADVVKYPHHGNMLLGDRFYKATKVKSIVVPNFGARQHPNQTVLNHLNDLGIKVYRQSDSSTGNILITSDGKTINFEMNV